MQREDFFRRKFGFPSPPRDRYPKRSCSLTRNVVANERELGKGREQGTEIGRKRTQGTQKMGNSTGQTWTDCERIRILAAIFVTERSLMFAYVRLKSLMFAFFEKKYFFPALWLARGNTQQVGDVSEMEWRSGVGNGVLEYRSVGDGRMRGDEFCRERDEIRGLVLNDAAGGGGDGEGVAAGGFLQFYGRGEGAGQERGGEDGAFF